MQTYYNVTQPTLWIPFGKYLGTKEPNDGKIIPLEDIADHYAKATLAAALITIPSQLFYDIFWATVYCLIAAPSLIIGIVAAIHAAAYNECIQKYESQEIAQTALGNIICAPYFVFAIAIDLCREVIALGTRTYASKIESPEGRAQNYWVADNKQFKTNF